MVLSLIFFHRLLYRHWKSTKSLQVPCHLSPKLPRPVTQWVVASNWSQMISILIPEFRKVCKFLIIKWTTGFDSEFKLNSILLMTHTSTAKAIVIGCAEEVTNIIHAGRKIIGQRELASIFSFGKLLFFLCQIYCLQHLNI